MSSTRNSSLAACAGLALAILVAPEARPAGQNKIVYDKFDWQIYQSTHFDMYHYSRERQTLQKVVSMA